MEDQDSPNRLYWSGTKKYHFSLLPGTLYKGREGVDPMYECKRVSHVRWNCKLSCCHAEISEIVSACIYKTSYWGAFAILVSIRWCGIIARAFNAGPCPDVFASSSKIPHCLWRFISKTKSTTSSSLYFPNVNALSWGNLTRGLLPAWEDSPVFYFSVMPHTRFFPFTSKVCFASLLPMPPIPF